LAHKQPPFTATLYFIAREINVAPGCSTAVLRRLLIINVEQQNANRAGVCAAKYLCYAIAQAA